MAEKAFNKKLAPSCSYCVYGNPTAYGEEILCLKRGITERRDSCRKFKYDPLKREPQRAKIADGYKAEDFKL